MAEDNQALKILRSCQYRSLAGSMADARLGDVVVVGRHLLPETALDLLCARTALVTAQPAPQKPAVKKKSASP